MANRLSTTKLYTQGSAGTLPLTRRPVAAGLGAALRRQATPDQFRTWLPLFLLLGATGLWALTLPAIDVRRITDVGLITALPPAFFAAILLLTASFCLVLRRPTLRVPLLLLHLFALALILYGTPTLVEEVPRFESVYKHTGIVEFIMQHRIVKPELDTYFSWPTFFVLSAFLTEAAGLQSPISFAGWVPVFLNVLALAPLVMIFRSATNDRRVIYLGVWFFYLTNWVGQDYFSPQGLNFFLYLVIIAILLQWFKVMPAADGAAAPAPGRRLPLLGHAERLLARWNGPAEVPNLPSRPWQRLGLLLMIVALFAVMVSSHQLTPPFTVAAVATLVIARRISPRGLPILMGLMVATWFSYMAVDFLAGHLNMVTGDAGNLTGNVSSTVVDRVAGSPGHVFVIQERLLMTAGVWGLAGLGMLLRMRTGTRDWTLALLAAVPFPLLVLGSYGGELLLRIYLFALPGVCFFMATLFFPTPATRASAVRSVLVALVSVALLGGFLVARYGNERMDYFTRAEISAVDYLDAHAPTGALLAAGSWDTPWFPQNYTGFVHIGIMDQVMNQDVDRLVQKMSDPQYPAAYILLTRSQEANLELFRGLTDAQWGQFQQALLATQRFHVVLSNPDAVILQLDRP